MAQGFYNLTENIKDELAASTFVNTVTYGDIFEIDLNKKDIFPLAHFIVDSVTDLGSTLSFSVSVLAMDIVDESKAKTTDKFLGNNNEQDVLNTQLEVVNSLTASLRRGTMYRNLYQIQGDTNVEPFVDRFENKVAGWTATYNILVKNDTSTC